MQSSPGASIAARGLVLLMLAYLILAEHIFFLIGLVGGYRLADVRAGRAWAVAALVGIAYGVIVMYLPSGVQQGGANIAAALGWALYGAALVLVGSWLTRLGVRSRWGAELRAWAVGSGSPEASAGGGALPCGEQYRRALIVLLVSSLGLAALWVVGLLAVESRVILDGHARAMLVVVALAAGYAFVRVVNVGWWWGAVAAVAVDALADWVFGRLYWVVFLITHAGGSGGAPGSWLRYLLPAAAGAIGGALAVRLGGSSGAGRGRPSASA